MVVSPLRGQTTWQCQKFQAPGLKAAAPLSIVADHLYPCRTMVDKSSEGYSQQDNGNYSCHLTRGWSLFTNPSFMRRKTQIMLYACCVRLSWPSSTFWSSSQMRIWLTSFHSWHVFSDTLKWMTSITKPTTIWFLVFLLQHLYMKRCCLNYTQCSFSTALTKNNIDLWIT